MLIRRLKRPHRLQTVCRAIAVPGSVSTRSELTEAGFAWLKTLACVFSAGDSWMVGSRHGAPQSSRQLLGDVPLAFVSILKKRSVVHGRLK